MDKVHCTTKHNEHEKWQRDREKEAKPRGHPVTLPRFTIFGTLGVSIGKNESNETSNKDSNHQPLERTCISS
ncbi:hypothetical protein [Burkholderia vietnamiensis]|uniref:hypothetical protein n=1 Tax=Burkholderia vietnamiensis TaxID=60552 RepID=UPI00264EB09C|nr:hypothetical protein [Burkholderia vietnamiensis]MDN8043378.1 hypothetical protein [Burkholderia vietnamiensis]